MTQGLILFAGQLVGKCKAVPASSGDAQSEPLCRSHDEQVQPTDGWPFSARDRMGLPRVPVPHASSPRAMSLMARTRPMAATADYGGFHQATSYDHHCAATSSSACPQFSPRRFSPHTSSRGSAAAAHMTSARMFGSRGPWRPGTSERRSGFVAAVDSSLPQLHCAILKDDVLNASEQIDEAECLATEHRVKCLAEEKEKGRKRAVRWRKKQTRRTRNLQEIARKQAEVEEQLREEEAAAAAKLEADMRWKKAVNRLSSKAPRPLLGLGDITAKRNVAREASSKLSSEQRGDSSHSATDSEGELGETPSIAGKTLFSWHATKETFNSHIQCLRRQQRLKDRSNRVAEQYVTRKLRYERLPEEERIRCQDAFLHFGQDAVNTALDVSGARDCLYEVGARGISVEEQVAVLHVASQAHRNAAKTAKVLNAEAQGIAGGDPFSELAHEVRMSCLRGGINLYTFAVVLLPQARKQLNSIRSHSMADLYEQKLDEEDAITFESCAEMIRSLSRDENVTAELVEKRAAELLADPNHIDEEGDGADRWLPHMRSRLSLELAQELAQEFCVAAEIKACAQERQIQKDCSIDRDTFHLMRQDVVILHKLYQKFTGNGSRPLSTGECDRIFLEFGMPHVNADHHVGEDGVDLVDLLNIVDQVRADLESAFNDLHSVFEDFPKVSRATKTLAIADMGELLASIDLKPSTEELQALLVRALEHVLAASAHHDGVLDFEQVKRVLQRLGEMDQRTRHEKEVHAALANGFLEGELDELRETFQVMDSDNSGTIESDEAWSTIKNLGFQISRSAFSIAFQKVDHDGSGNLEFVEFLKLLQLIRDGEGCFGTNRQIRTLGHLLRSELLRLMGSFNENDDGEAELLSDEELLSKACDGFGIAPNDAVQKKLHAKTFQDLCDIAVAIITGERPRYAAYGY